jgi:O-methyltransferase
MARTATQQVLFFLRWQLYPIVLALPAHLAFVLRGGGRARCTLWPRARLASHLVLIHLSVETGHNPKEALHIVEEIVELPPEVTGDIVECGAFMGGSTAKLSRAAALVGRRLIVCDSFEGLPDVGATDHSDIKPDFKKGEYRGRLDLVKRNVARYGRIDNVEFVQGWYDKTLGQIGNIRIACAFWDVDLQDSFRTCIKALWNKVIPGSKVFLHDIDRAPVVEVFTDVSWWRDQMGVAPPVFIGSYTGLSARSPLIGYVVKH